MIKKLVYYDDDDDDDDDANEIIKQHNPNWPQIPDHPYTILIIGGYRSEKTYSLFNLKNQQQDIDKIYLYANDQSEAKYQLLNNKRKSEDLTYFNDSSKAFSEYSNDRDENNKSIEECCPNKKRKILITFMIILFLMIFT